MFFTEQRQHFFKPLTGKYREVIVECLRLLYLRLYSALADYGHALNREQLLDIFQEALTRAPLMEVLKGDEESANDGEPGGRFKNNREQAGWILNQLLEYGWIERQVDEATLQSHYTFTRYGRLFTQPFVETDTSRVRTRHRNTRNTRNTLEAFLEHGEVYDLLDAYEYSERIINDFTDVIAELDERKRQLVKEVEAQVLVEKASEEFFDFMEKRFQPDIAVRLSADSVEKHRASIHKLIGRIRRQRKVFKANAERELRKILPENLIDKNQSYLFFILDAIESRLRNACDIMLPLLRKALQSFTQRADIIIRQMSFLSQQQHNDIVSICQQLSELPEQQSTELLLRAGEAMAGLEVKLLDPATVRLQDNKRKRFVHTRVQTASAMDAEARKSLYIQQMLDKAFVVNDSELRDYLVAALGAGYRISTRHLPLHSIKDFLALSHVIEVGEAKQTSSEYDFKVEAARNVLTECNEYFIRSDEFYIELIPTQRGNNTSAGRSESTIEPENPLEKEL